MNCDHVIGVRLSDDGDEGLLLLSKRHERINELRADIKEWAPTGNQIIARKLLALDDAGVLANTYHMFKYCPECGASIAT